MTQNQMQTVTAAEWRNSGSVCALSDAERHLGHIVNAGDGWIAFDATHPNEQGTAFRSLGFFPTITEAKEAVYAAVIRSYLAGTPRMD